MNMLKLSLITTALGCCGYVGLTQAEPLQQTTNVTANETEVFTDEFYEDTEGFEVSDTASDDGWGWNKTANASKTPNASIANFYSDSESSSFDDSDPDPIAPSKPAFVTYTPYTATGRTKVDWGSAKGYGLSVNYQLYRQKNNGSWSQIYNGSSTSLTDTSLSDGIYQYKIRACSTAGCSSYQTHSHMQVRYDAAAVQSLATTSKKQSKSVSQSVLTGGAPVAQLGYAFDAVKGIPGSSHCWNVASDSNIVGSTVTANTKELTFSIANSSASLATELEIDSTTGLSIEYGGYSAEYQYTKQLYSKTTSSSNSSVIVAKFKDKRQQLTSKGEPTLALTSSALNQLSANQTNFRTNCGDKYIDTLTMGRYVYLTIQVSASDKSKSEIETVTNSLKLDLGAINGNYSNTTKNTLTQTYKDYHLDIHAVSIGSGTNMITLTTISSLVDYLNDLENGPVNTLFPVDYTTKFYNIPSTYNTSNHFAVFSDYRPYLENIQSWNMLDQQVNARCSHADEVNEDGINFGTSTVLADGQKLSYYCSAVKRVILDNTANCNEHQFWSSCYSPASSSCVDTHSGNSQCMANMNKIPFWNSEVITGTLYARHTGGCWFSRGYRSGSDKICLSAGSVLDYSKHWNSDSYSNTNIHGFGTTQLNGWNVDQVRHTKTTTNGQQCIESYAKVYCDAGFGAGGKYESTQKLFGLFPTFDAYNY